MFLKLVCLLSMAAVSEASSAALVRNKKAYVHLLALGLYVKQILVHRVFLVSNCIYSVDSLCPLLWRITSLLAH